MWQIKQISPLSLTCTCFSPIFSHLSPTLLSCTLSSSLFLALCSIFLVYLMSSQARSIEVRYLKTDCPLCLSIAKYIQVHERDYGVSGWGEGVKQTSSPFSLFASLESFLVYKQPRSFLTPKKKRGLSVSCAAHWLQTLPLLLYLWSCFLSWANVNDTKCKSLSEGNQNTC